MSQGANCCISVVIPAYNESQNIVATVKAVVDSLTNISPAVTFEVIVIDDHSNDGTFEKVLTLGLTQVHCIRLSRRSGSHIGLRFGLSQAKGQAVLCVSADGQDDLAVLANMVSQWREGSQVVWARRNTSSSEPWNIRLSNYIFYGLLGIICKTPGETKVYGDFFLLDRCVVEAVNACKESNASIIGLIAWTGFKHTWVRYERKVRRSGKSKYHFFSRLVLAKDWVVSFSSFPVRFVFFVGLLIMLYAGVYFFCLSTSEAGVIIAAIFFVGGVILAALGITGEYVAQALVESRQRPIAFIERRTT